MKRTYKVPSNQISMFNLDAPSMPVFDKLRCKVKTINYETAARMIETYHYAHRVPGMVITLGMFIDNELAGVCAYSEPMPNIKSAICGKCYQNNVLELSRLFIFDYAGKNSESWFIGQSFNYIQEYLSDIFILLSYSDIAYNHLGIIYQATNWLYTGLSKSSSGREYQLPNGKIVTRRARMFRNGQNDNSNQLSWQEIQEIYPGIKKVQSSPKHRYVYFLGSKSQKKKLRKVLKWSVLPYPKQEGK